MSDDPVDPAQLVTALNNFARDARRLVAPAKDQEETVKNLRTTLANWADTHKDAAEQLKDLRVPKGTKLLEQVKQESNNYADLLSAALVEKLQAEVNPLWRRAKATPLRERIYEAIKTALPVFIYFENYGILDSNVYLPRFIRDRSEKSKEPRIRTINAMFKQGNLTPEDIQDLGQENPNKGGYENMEEEIRKERERKDLRSIKLSSASAYISEKFSHWFHQRRHKIKYEADGSYFRIWITDDRRPVPIELENRSKGFQWFFSFYLVFLAESDAGHKDAILLLDEPGLHLHPTAQQDLISFFAKLAENNQLLYTTHSPFLIDGDHLHRVRPVTEDKTGHSQVSVGNWPSDRDTIFPLQAAAGYAMIKGLFQHRKNVLVEGLTDYLYLHALSQHCHATSRQGLPEDIYITPCGGTKNVGHLAALFLGHKVRPVVLLDGDKDGRDRRNALMQNLYKGYGQAVLMLSNVFDQEECEIEDLVDEETILRFLKELLAGQELLLNSNDRSKGSLVDKIKSTAKRQNINLPDGWKAEIARRIVIYWSTTNSNDLSPEILDKAETLFKELVRRFDGTTL